MNTYTRGAIKWMRTQQFLIISKTIRLFSFALKYSNHMAPHNFYIISTVIVLDVTVVTAIESPEHTIFIFKMTTVTMWTRLKCRESATVVCSVVEIWVGTYFYLFGALFSHLNLNTTKADINQDKVLGFV